MFGIEDSRLIENLERMRQQRCGYGSTLEGEGARCDCKFGASGKGEQTGCPELRQAIFLIQGKFEEITDIQREMENSSRNAIRRIRVVLNQLDDEG